MVIALAGTMALCSSSPPAGVWSSQCALGGNAAAGMEMEVVSRSAAHNSTSKPGVLVGGLSSLFATSGARHSVCAGGDVSEAPCLSMGMVRSGSQTDLASLSGGSESRSIPKLKERSPVSVLYGPGGPVSVSASASGSHSGSHASQILSLACEWERGSGSASTSGADHVWERRRRPLECRRGVRSDGFDGRGDRLAAAFRSRVLDLRRPEADLASSDSDASDFGDELELEGLQTDALACAGGRRGPAWDVADSRERLLGLAERAAGIAPSLTQDAVVAEKVVKPKTPDEMLRDAQRQHRVFNNAFVVKAFRTAQDAHNGQFRRNGDLYLAHCVETAQILAASGADSTVVAAGLLHDTLDDAYLTESQLRVDFGEEVAGLVCGVSKLSKFSQLARDNRTVCNSVEADRLRTMFLSMVDARVVLIKLADRLHNMRTLGALSSAKQIRIADETLHIFAPLASRLGIWSWKAEMEDHCFRYLRPEEYDELSLRVAEGRGEGELLSSIKELDQALRDQGVEFTDLSGRPKNLYSIYSKMIRKGRHIDEIFDYHGLRLIVEDEASCYTALEVVHRLWSHVPEKLKDYIQSPKENGYQSLHTVVRGSEGHFLEVQIRTVKMHHQAEFGLAAHWRYKEGNHKYSSFILQKVEWARWVLTWQSEIMDTKVRLSPAQSDLRPPCPFPLHKDDCHHSTVCYQPPQHDDDPLFVILLENDKMVVQELLPGCTAADLMVERREKYPDWDSICATGSYSKEKKAKVNCKFVEDDHQKLRMGDLVEFACESEASSDRDSMLLEHTAHRGSPGDRCGQIAVEFQREQLKRLYQDSGDARRTPRLDRKPSSLAGLS